MYNSGGSIKVIAVDFGIKYNQIRCLIECDCQVLVVPWDYDFLPKLKTKGNYLFIVLTIKYALFGEIIDLVFH